MLKVSLHGVRGSRPRHRQETYGFGGNSTSLEFHTDPQFFLFVDGGSGLIKRGQEIARDNNAVKKFHFLMTHTHWDHILALPYFAPLFNSKNQVTFYAGDTKIAKFKDLFNRLFSDTHLGYDPSQIKAAINFVSLLPGDEIKIGPDTRISTFQLNHQGVTLSYRVNYKGYSAVIVTDHAPVTPDNLMGDFMAEKGASSPNIVQEYHRDFVAFLKDSDLVVYDTHFTEANLKLDWGHSTPERALAVCADAGVKTLSLFHHAPEDTDQEVHDKVESILAAALKVGVKVVASMEGTTWSPA